MATQPLQTLLDSVLTRLSALEANAGITPPAAGNDGGGDSGEAAALSPAVLAYDVYMEKAVIPLVEATDKIGTLENLGSLIKDAWGGIRIVVEIASRSKMPPGGGDLPKALSPHLKPVQTALESLRKLRLDRKYDWHTKSVMELAGCLSWVLIKPPPQTPSVFVKEAIASSTFWSNKIRKEYKGKDDDQIAFCDGLKKVGHDLVEYVTEHHRTGLTFNPQGGNLADAVATAAPETKKTEAPKPTPKPPAGGGGIGGLMAELQKKQTSDGASAATGLRKVTKDQQTWRKEFKGEKSSQVSAAPARSPPKFAAKPKVKGPPVLQFNDRGHKWVVENQTKESASGGLTIEVTDPKQQVYAYNCEDATIQVKGAKVKSIVLDKCRRVAVVFESCISSCEVVNCQRIQLQTTGVCPTFTIDKTTGCLIYLSPESMATTSFVASMSSEMNVSYTDPKDGEQKEVPIPEQFVHKLVDGAITSEVSDLYH